MDTILQLYIWYLTDTFQWIHSHVEDIRILYSFALQKV